MTVRPQRKPAKDKSPKFAYELKELHWMARRYADLRATSAPSTFNEITRQLCAEGYELSQPLYARDLHGRDHDKLTDDEAAAAAKDMPWREAEVYQCLRYVRERAMQDRDGLVAGAHVLSKHLESQTEDKIKIVSEIIDAVTKACLQK